MRRGCLSAVGGLLTTLRSSIILQLSLWCIEDKPSGICFAVQLTNGESAFFYFKKIAFAFQHDEFTLIENVPDRTCRQRLSSNECNSWRGWIQAKKAVWSQYISATNIAAVWVSHWHQSRHDALHLSGCMASWCRQPFDRNNDIIKSRLTTSPSHFPPNGCVTV